MSEDATPMEWSLDVMGRGVVRQDPPPDFREADLIVPSSSQYQKEPWKVPILWVGLGLRQSYGCTDVAPCGVTSSDFLDEGIWKYRQEGLRGPVAG